MPRGRPKSSFALEKIQLLLRRDVVVVSKLILLDHVRGKPKHGALGHLVTQLLDKHNKEFIKTYGTRGHAELAAVRIDDADVDNGGIGAIAGENPREGGV